ncbi:glycogen/starch/alpha-glucan phosphorylase [Streptobacillus moniliformis]|uniref:Alpha-1,4 glucan phosphorylase n=1 Tax=Streptobacillus moniliformis (strain ATCC 14647 / DSM 12112 / NCTC 10651 / 9901) TaxID=519441 RepID=D1AY82_STRM9|nr:glycogen/starch/alpha-glucan phosphorylase [Streptobacillus moniliformis]ACZ01258.1 glycogen/starch/alpha-glucan phosphorylase [Streptobacillus moniliformis DSM 12112]AVL42383.1 glycogen/starch/alpha-glucan phosphorylase [Streptobacillus moniliformis]QXW66002.1 glycogen/starch/alpha-glucan phosphorylase [Streptobacillus moniliformis]SQA13586.1 Maltodextrin phosphorylase [Streptobacillus moniliformis]
MDKKILKDKILLSLRRQYSKTLDDAKEYEIYYAVARATMDEITEHWYNTKKTRQQDQVKQMYYLSAEFLMGRYMSNNLINLRYNEVMKEVLEELGVDINKLEDYEMDAGLGNGGLGRLAACFLDSLATLGLPGHGYGLRYKYGMFEQKIENGFQVEYPDNWQQYGTPWSVKRIDRVFEVKFGGDIEIHKDEVGKEYFKRVNTENVLAVAYDVPVIGYGNNVINTLRLWEARSPEGFDLKLFNSQNYILASEKEVRAKDISRVLYPNDTEREGKILRLKQQFFFTSASLQDIIRRHKATFGNNFAILPEKVAIQLNDTHPVVAIPELMRILLDQEKLSWDEAWEICKKVFAYTNHTILSEALEKWEIDIFRPLLPRIYQIIEEINRRFLIELSQKVNGDYEKIKRMSIIGDDKVKMAWLAIVGSHAVNGVAQLHTEILKNQELKDWYELYPEKFQNKTNGVTQRRWLLNSNPQLASLITELIGDKWIVDLKELKKLEKYLDDDNVLNKLSDIKRENKVKLAKYIKDTTGIEVDVNSIFDIQVKRLHEYKRQLLNILHIMDLYNKLKENPLLDVTPRTFIFGAKAAPGYRRAKGIIKLINTVAEIINNDTSINNKIKVVFLENYRVSLAEKIFPAADISEQISTAGKEASGTGNMKFMLNGALTLGTLDGANVEIVEEVGMENAYIFGLKADEVLRLEGYGKYDPRVDYEIVEGLKKVVEQLIDGTYDDSHTGIFREIYNSLLNGVEGNRPDVYFVLKDFADYRKAQEKISKDYKDQKTWLRKSLLNISNAGKFSSDRTILDYAENIWDIKPCLPRNYIF